MADDDDNVPSSPFVARTPSPISPSMHSGNPANIAHMRAQQALRDANEAFRAAMHATHYARVAQRAAARAMKTANNLTATRTRNPGGGGFKPRRHTRRARQRKIGGNLAHVGHFGPF